jgi:signal transduction histidine kinase
MQLRQRVFRAGQLDLDTPGASQIIMGTTAASGRFSIIVSCNLERIPQAVQVLKRLLMPLSFIIGLFAIFAAWVFSRWFAKPINRLSVAAREMARGNYNVQVEACGSDEIGDLARDFNTMAHEVGRSAALQRDLLANVSHDLRTPLTLIKGYAETVRDLTGGDVKKRTDQLNVIVDESDRLSALVGSVMELSRMSSGAERPSPVRFDLTELCDELALRYEDICKQNGQSFTFEGEPGCLIEADPALMERALHNLLGNALNHVGEDGYIGLKVYKTGYGMARCEVVDHGPGISPQDLPHLFDRYYRSRADAGKPGTGLGLSITKAIFNAHQFDFGVTSNPGEGAAFWFEAGLLAQNG